MGNRIYAGDAQESIHYAMFRNFDNRIVIFGDDTIPRFTTASALLDYDTVAGGDKFGNVFVLRLPQDASLEVDEDTTGNSSVYERGYLQGAQYKVMPFNYDLDWNCFLPSDDIRLIAGEACTNTYWRSDYLSHKMFTDSWRS